MVGFLRQATFTPAHVVYAWKLSCDARLDEVTWDETGVSGNIEVKLEMQIHHYQDETLEKGPLSFP